MKDGKRSTLRSLISEPDFVLYVGDARDVLAQLPDDSVHCCVTSPPYWGLRDYGTGQWEGGDPGCDHKHDTQHQKQGATSARAGRSNTEDQRNENVRDVCGKCGATRVDRQLGLEQTPDEYVARMVAVFREVRRVLRDDGTLWLNLGDSYASNSATGATVGDSGRGSDTPTLNATYQHRVAYRGDGIKAKDLVGIPWRVAFALQADGWWLRSDIIWAKPNPMPESVTDRPTKAHEYVFLLTKSPRYFFDQEAVREELRWTRENNPDWNAARAETNAKKHPTNRNAQSGWFAGWQPPRPDTRPQDTTLDGSDGEAQRGPDGRRQTAVQGGDGSIQHRDGERWPNGGRNARSVWEIATKPYTEAHFATFPTELPRRCIAAGTSERGCCPECGSPWERIVVAESADGRRAEVRGRKAYDADGKPLMGDNMIDPGVRGSFNSGHTTLKRETTGWRPSCSCDITPGGGSKQLVRSPVPCVVLDPFMGAGTTALVARGLGRKAIGIEINPDYAKLCDRRNAQKTIFAEAS